MHFNDLIHNYITIFEYFIHIRLKPNILFFLIDGLREDKCHGNKKTSVTPHIDSLIQNGVYFNQTICSAPVTPTALSSLFTGLYPSEAIILNNEIFTINQAHKNYVQHLKEIGYTTYAFLPEATYLFEQGRIFEENVYKYPYTDTLFNGNGKLIVEKLKENHLREPWFYYLHLYDLLWISPNAHFNLNDGPDEISNDKFGINKYERIFSVMDIWFGRILHNLDLKNTLIVLTADHGADLGIYTPTMEQENKNFQKLKAHDIGVNFRIIQNIAKKLPKQILPFRKKLANKYTAKNEENIKNKIQAEFDKIEKSELSPYEKRIMKFSVIPIQNIYDEKYRVPLIFSGYNIPSGVLISEQVRSVDIFSTIADIIGLNNINENKRGRSLLPLMQGKHFDELPAYVESAINAVKSLTDDAIGIRTSKFKYFRDRNDSVKNVHLYDLKNDPLEEKNIAKNNKDVVAEMEKQLVEILKGESFQHSQSNEELDEEQSDIIDSELKRLGYIN